MADLSNIHCFAIKDEFQILPECIFLCLFRNSTFWGCKAVHVPFLHGGKYFRNIHLF